MAQLTLSFLEETGLHEELTFSWKIPNFRALYEAAKSNSDENAKILAKVGFTVGEKYKGIPTAWQFYLKLHDLEVENVEIYLELLGSGCHTAEYEVLVKHKINQLSQQQINIYVDRTLKHPKRRYARCNSNGAVSESGLSLGAVREMFAIASLSGGELQLKFKITVYYPSEIEATENLSTDLKNALDSGVGADVTFIFKEEGSGKVIEKIPAHRLILSIRSPVFATMFATGMIEATKGDVEISDMTPKAMKILLTFIYTGEMDSAWADVPDEVIYGADKYQLDQLKTFLCENIAPVLTPMNAMKIRNAGELHNLPEVVETTTKFMKDNFGKILQNYDVTLKNSTD